MDELRNFFKENKIKMSTDQKTELNEIIDSLSSALNSVILSKAAMKIGEAIASTVKDDLINVMKSDKNKPLSSTISPGPRPIAQTSLPRSYADAIKVMNKNRKINPDKLYSDKRNVIFVRKNDKSVASISDINLLLKKDQNIKINRIYDNSNNFKIISYDSNSSDKLKNHLEQRCGLEVTEKSLFNPCVCISGVPRDLKEDHLISELCFRNGAPEKDTKILRKIFSNSSAYDRIIVRSTAEFRDQVLKIGRVFVGASSFRVEDYINTLKCFKCQRYGHAMKNCLHEVACGLCSEPHYTRDCPNKENAHKCINCIRGNKPATEHSTNWKKCPFYVSAVINQTNLTEYGPGR